MALDIFVYKEELSKINLYCGSTVKFTTTKIISLYRTLHLIIRLMVYENDH